MDCESCVSLAYPDTKEVNKPQYNMIYHSGWNDMCYHASWVAGSIYRGLTMTLKEAEWGWCDNCTLSLFGVGRVELAGTHPQFFSLGQNIDHWSGALYQQSTYLLFQQNTDWTHFSFLSLVIKETMVILNEKNKMLLWFLLLLLAANFTVLYIEESKNIQNELQRKRQIS